MNLRVRLTTDKLKKIKDLRVGDIVITENKSQSIKSVITFASHYYLIKLADSTHFELPEIFTIKTTEGFKVPMEGDKLVRQHFEILCVSSVKSVTKKIFHDILVDDAMLTEQKFIIQTGGIRGSKIQKDA